MHSRADWPRSSGPTTDDPLSRSEARQPRQPRQLNEKKVSARAPELRLFVEGRRLNLVRTSDPPQSTATESRYRELCKSSFKTDQCLCNSVPIYGIHSATGQDRFSFAAVAVCVLGRERQVPNEASRAAWCGVKLANHVIPTVGVL